jgi:hypothetical protein
MILDNLKQVQFKNYSASESISNHFFFFQKLNIKKFRVHFYLILLLFLIRLNFSSLSRVNLKKHRSFDYFRFSKLIN